MASISPASLNTTSDVISMKTCGCACACDKVATNTTAEPRSERPINLTREVRFESRATMRTDCAQNVESRAAPNRSVAWLVIMRLREVALHQPAIAPEHYRAEIGEARHQDDRRAGRKVEVEGNQQSNHARQECDPRCDE